MIIPQLSVFLENKSGRLTEVLEVLGEENIKISPECCRHIGVWNTEANSIGSSKGKNIAQKPVIYCKPVGSYFSDGTQ